MPPAEQRGERADAQRNRQKVLETADRLLAERGTSVTLGDIAAAAGVGAGTVYRHFPTKEALMATVLDIRTEQLAERGWVLREEAASGEAFFAFLRHVCDEAFANRATCEALAARGDWRAPLKSEGRCVIDAPLAVLLADAQRAGAVRPDLHVEDARALMLGFVAMAQSLDSPDRARFLSDVLWAGLRAAPEKRNTSPSNETPSPAILRNETRPAVHDETGHRCPVCGEPIAAAGTGRPPKYCSPACRQRAFRAKQKAAAEAAAR